MFDMKKILLFLSIVLFVSCSSDDDNTKSGTDNFVGVWSYEKITADVETSISTTTQTIKDRLTGDTERMGGKEFTKDGDYKYYDGIDKRWYSGKYKIENGKIYLGFYEKSQIVWENEPANFTVNGDILVLAIDETEQMKRAYPESNVKKAIQYIEHKRVK